MKNETINTILVMVFIFLLCVGTYETGYIIARMEFDKECEPIILDLDVKDKVDQELYRVAFPLNKYYGG